MTRTVLLGDIAKVGDGLHGTPIYVADGNVPFINGNNLENGKIIIKSDTKMCGDSEFVKYDKRLSKNTVLLSINGTIGNLARYDGHRYVLGKSACYIDITSPEQIDADYLYYLCSAKHFQDFIRTGATGTTIKNVPLKAIRNYKVGLPSIEVQKKIAHVLGAIDEKIELNRKMNETLEHMGQALFRHYFFDNPEVEKWEDGMISDLGEVATGKTPSKANDEYYGQDVMFLKVPDMHGNSVIINTEDGLSTAGADSQSKKYIPKWSTCVSCIATVGIVSLAGERLQTNQQINSIIPKSNEYTFFNYLLLTTKSGQLKDMASGGSATPNLNKGQFEKIKIKLPPNELLSQFHVHVTPLFEKIDLNTREIQTLTTLRDTLLPRLIDGKIKV